MNNLSKHLTMWQRFWRSKGFGVHSPFAFYFITNVMRQKYHYYAYESIEYLHTAIKQAIKHTGKRKRPMSLHNAKLLFRIVNYFNPLNVLQIGSNYGLSAATTLMVNSKNHLWLFDPASLTCDATSGIFTQFESRITHLHSIVNAVTDYPAALADDDHPFIVINSISHVDNYSQLQYFVNSILDSEGVVIFRNIANDRLMRQMWEDSRQYAQHGMSFSNDRLAVFVARQSLPRQDFSIWI